MISSFFIRSLQKQPLLVHGTSPRYYEMSGGKKEPLCPHRKDSSKLFRKHQSSFLQSLEINNEVLFRTRQVHGKNVFVLKDPKISTNDMNEQEADAIVTHLPDCPVMVLTADCVPIIIYDPVKNVTGVVHAGRLGTQKGILTNTIKVLSHEYGSNPKDLIVGMGPAIGGCCYEVDEKCALPFIKRSSVNSGFVRKTGQEKFFLDLPRVNRLEGCEAGVLGKNIHTDGPCTACDNHRWYSYRKEGNTGKLMTLAMIRFKK